MARSHIAVAVGAAVIALLIFGQLVIDLGFPNNEFWHRRLDQHSSHGQQDLFMSTKQDGGLVADPSQYLIGVGKADITGFVPRPPASLPC